MEQRKIVKYFCWYLLYCDSFARLLFGQIKLSAELGTSLYKGRNFPFLEHWWWQFMEIQISNWKAWCWGTTSHIRKWLVIMKEQATKSDLSTDQWKSKLLKVTYHCRLAKEKAAESDLSFQINKRASCWRLSSSIKGERLFTSKYTIQANFFPL